jgi:3-isopropylmalate/(R)-2-methylmalate dehydratase large subunit
MATAKNKGRKQSMEKKSKTAFQKIVEAHLVEILLGGDMVLRLDKVWCHEITLPPAVIDAEARGIDFVFNPNKIKVMIDHVNPPKDKASAVQSKITREFARKHRLEFSEIGRNGVCHALIPEKGWVNPGEIGIMGDSHTCTHGAFCTFSAGVGTTEVEVGIAAHIWVCPPQKVIRVNFIGKLPSDVYSKDLILSLIKKIGVKGATNAVLEFGGNVIDEISMEARMTITNMAVEAGATSGMINVDKIAYDYLSPEISIEEFKKWNSDLDAKYDQVIEIDVTDMVPVITNGFSPENVVSVLDPIVNGKKIDQVYIGSCTNGRLEDLRIAAEVFKLTKEKIADDLRCIIVPATQYIYGKAIEEGLIEIFVKAGCYVNGPTCGACLGMSCGVIAPGEICVSTTNRNFPGRMGEGGMVHLASPLIAAYSALAGRISSVPNDLCKQVMDAVKIREEKFGLGSSNKTKWEEIEFEKPNYSLISEKISACVNTDFSGKVFYLDEKNVDTDQIIPARYLNETDKKFFGKHCLEDAGLSMEHKSELLKSKILVSNENFGCGSSREHAPWALEGAGIRCVIAPSFARIFENNMFANGLLAIVVTAEEIAKIDSFAPQNMKADWENEKLILTKRKFFFFRKTLEIKFSLSQYRKTLIREGGLISVMIKKAAELQKKGRLD